MKYYYIIRNFLSFKQYKKISFQDVEKYWKNEVENNAERNIKVLLLGNKCDSLNERAVSENKGKVLFFLQRRKYKFY